MSGEEGEVLAKASSGTSEDWKFDEAIGFLQEVLLDDQFLELQRGFLEDHCFFFEDVEENRFHYMDIFKKYSEIVEKYVENALKSKITDFSMENFMTLLKSRKEEVGEEILDLLSSFSDFLDFKQTILNYKAEKEGRSLDLASALVVKSQDIFAVNH